MSCLPAHVLQGQTYTCWFASIINGFMSSSGTRKIMENALFNYMSGKNTRDRQLLMQQAQTTCPTKTASRFNFWKFVYHTLYPPATGNAPTRSVKNMVFNVLPARRGGTANFGHTNLYIIDVLNRLGITNYILKVHHVASIENKSSPPNSDFLLLGFQGVQPPTGKFIPLNFTEANVRYNLNNVIITFQNLVGTQLAAHAIAGVKCNNQYYIYDSNHPEKIPCDWRDFSNIRQALSAKYPSGPLKVNQSTQMYFSYAIYLRSDREFPALRTKNQFNTELPRLNVAQVNSTQLAPPPVADWSAMGGIFARLAPAPRAQTTVNANSTRRVSAPPSLFNARPRFNFNTTVPLNHTRLAPPPVRFSSPYGPPLFTGI